MKKFLKKNMVNIPFVIIILFTMGIVSSWDVPKSAPTQIDVIKHVQSQQIEPETSAYTPSVQTMIIQYCKDYRIGSSIPLAIAKLETGHFTSEGFLQYNNVGGLMRDGRLIKFESLDEGVNSFVRNLAKNYYSHGLNNPEDIGKKYCPETSEKWAEVVKELM